MVEGNIKKMVSKKRLCLFGVLFLLLVLGIGVYAYSQIPNPGHGGDKVLVTINGFTMTLQEAIDYGFLVDGASSPEQDYTTEISGSFHTSEEIWVSIDGDEKTLQQAILTTLCGSVSSSYTLDISLGHSANEILVSVDSEEMSLQDAIDEGMFCSACVSHDYFACYKDNVWWYDSCGNREDKKQNCNEYSGEKCSDNLCVIIIYGYGCDDCPEGVGSFLGTIPPFNYDHWKYCESQGNEGRYRNPLTGEWYEWGSGAFCYKYPRPPSGVEYDIQWEIKKEIE